MQRVCSKFFFGMASICALAFVFSAGVSLAEALPPRSPSSPQDLRVPPAVTCNANDHSPRNLFNCCVSRAQRITFKKNSPQEMMKPIVVLESEGQICRDAHLQRLEFSFRMQTPSGLRVFDLTSPKIENTPFFSSRGLPTKFWLNLASNFEFSNSSLDLGYRFIPFLFGAIGVDEQETWGLTNRIFGTDYDTKQGWSLNSEKILSQTQQTSICPPARGECTFTIQEIEQTWINTETQETRVKTISRSN